MGGRGSLPSTSCWSRSSIVDIDRSLQASTCNARSRSSRIFAFLHFVCLLWPLLPEHPLPNVGRTMKDCAAFCLIDSEEAHYLYIHQCNFLQVQYNPGSAVLHLCLQLLEMFRLHVPYQPDRCLLPVRIFFNFQYHLRFPRPSTVLRGCNTKAIRKLLKNLHLLQERLPNFRQLLNSRQNRRSSRFGFAPRSDWEAARV